MFLSTNAVFINEDENDDEDTRNAKYILQKILESGQNEITKRELYQRCSRTRFPTTKSMYPALNILVKNKYITFTKTKKDKCGGGRPSESIMLNVNPSNIVGFQTIDVSFNNTCAVCQQIFDELVGKNINAYTILELSYKHRTTHVPYYKVLHHGVTVQYPVSIFEILKGGD